MFHFELLSESAEAFTSRMPQYFLISYIKGQALRKSSEIQLDLHIYHASALDSPHPS
jgi:hypothetical protein